MYMKMYRSIVILICLLSAGIRLNGQTVTIDSNQKRMEWFDQAKLGIFIHWGIYAVDGVSESWSFFNNYLPYDQYMNQMKGFTASKYNPKEWVDLIK